MKEKLNRLLEQSRLKVRIIAVLGLVLLTGILGATYAFRSHNNELDNLLKAHKVSGAIIENEVPVSGENDFNQKPTGNNIGKKVQFRNTGDVAVFVRIAYAQTWQDKGGGMLPYVQNGATFDWNDSEWTDGGDGWHYYKKVLKAGDTTAPVMNTISFNAGLGADYKEGGYQLTFVMEMVQCSDETAVNNAALSATFGKTATVSGMTIDNGAVTGGTVNW